MRVLIAGGGGHEYAITWKAVQSPRVEKLYCVPGDVGIAQVVECMDIDIMDFDAQVVPAKEHEIDLIIVGLDDPLAAGAVDAFEATGTGAFGPKKNTAVLEGSKAFFEDLMKKYNIPTAGYEILDFPEEALTCVEHVPIPTVLRMDGLALGEGVLIHNTREEAKDGVKTLMLDKQSSFTSDRTVVEEFMTGRKVPVLPFVDGETIKIMTSTQGHERAKSSDQGLNMGGMGAFSLNPFYMEEVDSFCRGYVYQPAADAMGAEEREFQGIIFLGLMFTEQGPKVSEYNARFGDPETQVVLPRMKNDIMDVFKACADDTLDQAGLEFEDNAVAYVVPASARYPEHYEKRYRITGSENFKNKDGYYVSHAGSKFDAEGNIMTDGGRLLEVTVKGATLKEARENACKATEWIEFGSKCMRHDTGKAIDEA